jgi:hypothetical protein
MKNKGTKFNTRRFLVITIFLHFFVIYDVYLQPSRPNNYFLI